MFLHDNDDDIRYREAHSHCNKLYVRMTEQEALLLFVVTYGLWPRC